MLKHQAINIHSWLNNHCIGPVSFKNITIMTSNIKQLRYVHTCVEQRRAANWLQHKSLHAFTHTWSQSGGGAGAKSTPLQMGPTPNFPHQLQNRALQNIFVLKKLHIRPRPLRFRSAYVWTYPRWQSGNVKIRLSPLHHHLAYVWSYLYILKKKIPCCSRVKWANLFSCLLPINLH